MIEQTLYTYKKEGYSFFNTATAEKKSITKWKKYMEEKPTDQEIESWLSFRTQNYAIVCGEISDLVVIDIDTKNGADPTPFLNRGLREIRTPSGGYHIYIKFDPLLASTRHKKDPKKGILFAVDIQSNSSFVFAPPSKFPNGGYEVINDVPVQACPDDLLAEIVNELKLEKKATTFTPYTGPKNPESGRPGDIFNAEATWDQILIPAGWTRLYTVADGTTYWRRPGKTDGISASTDYNGFGLFFAFTTSTELEPDKGYSKFNLYTQLNYDGDFRKAAVSLVRGTIERTMSDYERLLGIQK